MKHTDEFLNELLTDFEENELLTLVKEGDWEQDSKDQHRTDVYQHIPTGTFVAITQSRRGAYWSDWDYGDSHIEQVWPTQVTRTEYVAKEPA